jgi:excisionase family DNA binding protein
MSLEDNLITLSEAAKLLSVSRAKISRLVSNNALQTINDPLDQRVKLVRREDVLALRVRPKAA